MIRKYLVLVIIIFLPGFIYSQNPEGVPISSAEKFNRRGFISNDGIQVNGKEIISDYDGNLILQYSTPLELMSRLSSNFTITYNANIEHKIFTSSEDRSGMTVNYPEWIMGFNGFALQVMNFERLFDFPYIEGRTTYYGQEIPLLIPGYHFSNNMLFGTVVSDKNDFISILKSDGSKLILTNVEDDSYTGIYLDRTPGHNGFAIVKLISDTDFQKRAIWYKPGDGLTYYFEEEFVDLDFKNATYGQKSNMAKAAYLKKIIDVGGDYVEFIYSANPAAGINLDKGRKAFVSIESSKLSSINSQLTITYAATAGESLYYINITNHNYGGETFQFYTYQPANYIFDDEVHRNDLVYYNEVSKQNSRIVFFNKVIHNNTRTDLINYYSIAPENHTDRKYQIGSDYFFTLDAYLINEVNYFNGKKVKFDYNSEKFELDPVSNMIIDANSDGNQLDLGNTNQFINQNIEYTYRDCFTNFMIKKKNVYDENDNLIYTDEYTYRKEDGPEYIWDYHATGIVTRIRNYSTAALLYETLNTPVFFITEKNYSKFAVNDLNYSQNDNSSTIKLINETIFSGSQPKIRKSYQYEVGDTISIPDRSTWHFFNGTFFLENSSETRYENGTQVVDLITDYTNTADSLVFGSSFYKKIKSSVIVRDPKSLYTYRKYKNFIPSNLIIPADFSDTTYFYLLGLTEEVKDYSTPDSVRSHIKYEFFDTGSAGYQLGKLKKTIVNPLDNFEYSIDYSYYAANYYAGQLYRESIISKDFSKTYLYPYNFGTRSLTGSIVKYNGEESLVPVTLTGSWQLKPEETVISYDGKNIGNKTLFDPKGNLLVSAGADGKISSFEYDTFGRILRVALPGSFTDGLITATNYSTKFAYDDVNNKIIGESCFSDIPPVSFDYNFRNEYDVLGRLKRTYLNNEKKNEKEYYFFGAVLSESEFFNSRGAYNRTYEYDYLKRVTKILFNPEPLTFNNSGVQQTNYTWLNGNVNGINYTEKLEFTDEEGKKTFSYYDITGNKIAERKGSETAAPTLFYYNSIYRLRTVVSPEGIETNYKYDRNGNVRYKHSPDYGTYKYKYDKFSRLRFQYHVESQELVFNNYDGLDRLLSTGVINNYTETSFDSLSADAVNSIVDNNQNFFVHVNTYDNSSSSGVFADIEIPQNFIQENLKGRLSAEAYRDKPGDGWSYKLYSYDYLGRIKEQRIQE